LLKVGETAGGKSIGRRGFLLTALAAGMAAPLAPGRQKLLGALLRPSFLADDSTVSVRQLLTPNTDFFIRNHFQTPQINDESWSLALEGMVAKPIKLSYADLLLMPAEKGKVTLECAGNPSGGAGVGTAVWSGVPLAKLLQQAGVQSGASTVVFHGADSGDGEDAPPGTRFARAIPLEKAMDPHTLLVYEMNGAPLPAEHGFPLRALVSGWYGMDSVKWLTRIAVLQQPFTGFFQQQEYIALKANGQSRPISGMQVNSKFLRPSEAEEVRGKSYRIEGLAWAGERKIGKVELRVDGGQWQAVVLSAPTLPLVWTSWSFEWQIPHPGAYTLEIRATDVDGRTQPETRDPDRKDAYELNSCSRITVNVRG
jgi:DMSO/TMAO reductase YedYZ molybdopterin-dependent catalytic subunit